MKIRKERALSWLTLCLVLATSLAASSSSGQIPDLPPLTPVKLAALGPVGRKAVEEAHQAVQAHLQDASANGKLGVALHAQNLLEEAEVCYRRAALLDPSSFPWKYYLALILMESENVGEAAVTLREALRLEPAYFPAQLKLGESLLASGKWQEAAQFYSEILAGHPKSAEAYYGLGRVLAVRKDLAAAVEHFRKATEIVPDYGAAHYALAQTYKRMGKMDQAVEHLRLYDQSKGAPPAPADALLDEIQALRVDPAEELRQSMELADQGKLEESVTLIENLLQSHPRLVEAHVGLILLYARLGQFAKGEEHYLAAKRLNPNHPGSFFNRGLLLARQGSVPRAEREFRRALEINPAYPEAHTKLAYTLEAQNRWSEAAAVFRQAIENNPEDSQAHFGLGRVLVKQEDYQEGLPHLLKSVDTHDEDNKPAYLYALGAAYARSGDAKKGVNYLRLAREKAAARGQVGLVENIDQDLRALETAGASP